MTMALANCSAANEAAPVAAKIDRQALVSRHKIVLTRFEGNRPLQVGNGEFAFGMDATGLQTFAPFNTMSHWGWGTSPLPAGTKRSDYQMQPYEMHGRKVLMPMEDPNHPEISKWLTGNPHAINLGRVGLTILKADGSLARQEDLGDIRQELDMWTGIATSRFTIESQPVTVTTAVHPTTDAVAAKVDSPLVKLGRIAAFVDFPGDDGRDFTNFVGNWNSLDSHAVKCTVKGQRASFAHTFTGNTSVPVYAALSWQGGVTLNSPDDGETATLVIQKAEYGARDKWVNVTASLSKLVKKNRLRSQVTNEALGVTDPIKNVAKSLKVTYLLGDKSLSIEIREGEVLAIQCSISPFRFTLGPEKKAAAQSSFSLMCAFSPKPITKATAGAEETFAASRASWRKYWETGGAVDLSQSKDPRWKELERRIVVSQYLMKVNEAGSLPPQESGLVNNGWFGRFHFEMIWWHAAQWASWNKWPEFESNMAVYKKFLAQSKALAKIQGYKGGRWPKAVGNDGEEWPFWNHAVMIWQQPHPIFFAEMDYRSHPTQATLEKWRPIVENTADFLASFAYLDPKKGTYVLGPPLSLVSENTEWTTTADGVFELGYWRTGLRLANQWRERLGQPRKPEWDKVMKGLSPLPVQDGLYVTHADIEDMWTKWNFEHPALTGIYGMLPGDGVDVPTMNRTFDKVRATWNYGRVWGWDFPMLAMCAAKLGKTEDAVSLLLDQSPNFQFDERGLATGGPFPYFPSNGGLLYTVAYMAAGWDGAPKKHAPGFPDNGQWTVRFENLNPAL
ncbi:hypothetical protein EON80_02145 [bacterium]|nr:MAG: hypothetical protein EON80_02145 [bacterium]